MNASVRIDDLLGKRRIAAKLVALAYVAIIAKFAIVAGGS